MSNEPLPSARSLCRILFTKSVDIEAAEQTLLLAILAVACLHGEAAVRLDVGYAIDTDRRIVVIDTGTPIGRATAQVFIGFCAREFGDEAFVVVRLGGAGAAPSRAGTPDRSSDGSGEKSL